MLSKRLIRCITIVGTLGVLRLSVGYGDTIEATDVTRSGKVVEINDAGVSLLQGCTGGRVTVAWKEIASVAFNDSCEMDTFVSPSHSGATAACNGGARPSVAYAITFKGQSGTVYASTLTLKNDTFRAEMVNNRGTLISDVGEIGSKIRFISRPEVCPEDLAQFEVPAWLSSSPK